MLHMGTLDMEVRMFGRCFIMCSMCLGQYVQYTPKRKLCIKDSGRTTRYAKQSFIIHSSLPLMLSTQHLLVLPSLSAIEQGSTNSNIDTVSLGGLNRTSEDLVDIVTGLADIASGASIETQALKGQLADGSLWHEDVLEWSGDGAVGGGGGMGTGEAQGSVGGDVDALAARNGDVHGEALAVWDVGEGGLGAG